MKINKNKKGFTLTELIIVIVIIGILAAVLIPSLSSYIKKAKISKGEQEAREMNTILAAEAIYQDKEYFEPYEVTNLLKQSNFKLESQLADYRFWYDASENKVKYLSMNAAFEGTSAAGKTFTQDCIEALSSAHPEYRYVDTYDDELAGAVNAVRNLITNALSENSINDSKDLLENSKKIEVLNSMDKIISNAAENMNSFKVKGLSSSLTKNIKTSITNYINTFDTANSVYVDNNIMYNRAYFAASDTELAAMGAKYSNFTYSNNGNNRKMSMNISHMVFENEISIVPACKTTIDAEIFDVVVTTPISVPDTVTVIKAKSFTNITYCTSIIVSETVIADNEAYSESAKLALTNRNSNVSFVTLYLGTDFNITYNTAEAKLNNGITATNVDDGKQVKLSAMIYDVNTKKLIYNTDADVKESSQVLSKYLIPSIEFTNSKIDFSKFAKNGKFIIRRSLLENICTYTGILIDDDLNCYKVESFGYVTDIDWNIEQNFISKDKSGNNVIGATEATIKVYLPTYVYNFTNFRGASMEIVVLPQHINSKEMQSMTGKIDVYDGIALSTEPIKFYIEDGIYDANIGKYVYEKKIENLNKYSVLVNGLKADCNQLTIDQISIYTGKVSYDESGNADTSSLNYLFMRYYQNR